MSKERNFQVAGVRVEIGARETQGRYSKPKKDGSLEGLGVERGLPQHSRALTPDILTFTQ